MSHAVNGLCRCRLVRAPLCTAAGWPDSPHTCWPDASCLVVSVLLLLLLQLLQLLLQLLLLSVLDLPAAGV